MRSLSSLIILKRIMYGIERQLGFDENSLLPCDYFDLIAGTSTGGYVDLGHHHTQLLKEEVLSR